MNIKHLERAAQISKELPKLEEARRVLSQQQSSFIEVHDGNNHVVELPQSMKYNLTAQINVEINKLKEEVAKL